MERPEEIRHWFTLQLSNNVLGTDNVAIGTQSLQSNISGSQNTAIGKNADVSANGISNWLQLSKCNCYPSNTIQLGSDGSGSHTAITDKKLVVLLLQLCKVAGGTAAQF
jgi:hypothetical protein